MYLKISLTEICIFFHPKQCDTFTVEAAGLGRPFKLKIHHDNSGFSPAWFLDRVEVVDPDNETYVFHCERWIGKGKDDGKLERVLYVKVWTYLHIWGDISIG